ncbi:hypothetical protein XAPC_4428 [Xanthomonas citri pv. punicae str. LMG 859]|nr:hypothetical protein XAPC_4428 [Xanthomonas citri pv. punicae str. LMG 859]
MDVPTLIRLDPSSPTQGGATQGIQALCILKDRSSCARRDGLCVIQSIGLPRSIGG